ncbi:putative NADPH specific quinone oxidoreductase [Pseudomonas aeruginosa]|nr:putative NADPH specific quinone oxidoreductase [Pseudomonas aeruginosa]
MDVVYFPFHKANQFLGMSGLPTFLAVDVMKRPDVPATVAAYQAHLDRVFGRAG